VLERWRPTLGDGGALTLSPILAPLAPVQQHLVVLDHLDMRCAWGEQHQSGLMGLLTGTPQNVPENAYPGGPSIDQVIAARISAGKKPIPSLELAVRWGTGRAFGLLAPRNALNFELAAPYNPIPPRIDPVQIWNTLFGEPSRGEHEAAKRLQQKKSVLDFLDRRYVGLSRRLGAADRMKLEQHLTKIREIEQALETTAATAHTTKSCRIPELPDTSNYNPNSGATPSEDGRIKDTVTDNEIPRIGKLMTDMLVMALACDMTAVGTLQWSDTEALYTLPWLGLQEHHHYYQHDGGFRPAECEQIATWYSTQHLYLLQSLASVDMGGHSLLDESVVFFGTELQEPPTHAKNNIPLMLAGHGGGLRTGRMIDCASASHNDLLVSIQNLFGEPSNVFGAPQYCTGPLSGL
jgi:hypothetical protein